MSDRSKKVFLFFCVVVPFIFYCIYYYTGVLKNAPYKFKEFVSMNIQYGDGPVLQNRYDSKTGDYQYVDTRDSVIKMKLHLTKADFLILHRKAAEQGFWDFPSIEGDTTVKKGPQSLRYVIEFNYQHKSKKVIFYSNYYADPKLIDANRQLIKQIQNVLDKAEQRENK